MGEETSVTPGIPEVLQVGKNPWLSKTLWVNAGIALTAFVLGNTELVQGVAGEHYTELVIATFALVNTVLRFVTKEPIAFKK